MALKALIGLGLKVPYKPWKAWIHTRIFKGGSREYEGLGNSMGPRGGLWEGPRVPERLYGAREAHWGTMKNILEDSRGL